MDISKEQIRSIVNEVISEINHPQPDAVSRGKAESNGKKYRGVYYELDDAVEAAVIAQKKLMELDLAARKRIVDSVRKISKEYARELAEDTLRETGMGRIEDKITKFMLAADYTQGLEGMKTDAFSGDHGLTLVEWAPYGVIGAIMPSTHPVPTMISNFVNMISAGNSMVVGPHPAGKKVSAKAVDIFNRTICEAGGPENLIVTVYEPSIKTSKALFSHPKINLLCITGGPGVVKAAMKSNKRVIAAGPGNPPVVVDETADLCKAAKSIIEGSTFDNNVLCLAEKEVLVVDSAAECLMENFEKHGAVRLSTEQMNKIGELAFGTAVLTEGKPPVLNRKMVGRNAHVIAEMIGLKIDPSVRMLFGETGFNHILVQEEQMMPVMPVVRMRDVNEAIECALKVEHGYKHTAVMHSTNIENLSKMARIINTCIFVKNGPSGAGNGAGGEGFMSFSIAGYTGEGITSPMTFTRMRRCVLVDNFRII